jgi:CheY-like chemotaxis protein
MPNILLVDDDDDSREVLGELLREEGHDVRLAHGGNEALSLLPELSRPCTILLDLNMPEADGELVLSALAEMAIAGAFPVIVMSADEREIQVPYSNIVARLSKPFELGVLRRALAKAGEIGSTAG